MFRNTLSSPNISVREITQSDCCAGTAFDCCCNNRQALCTASSVCSSVSSCSASVTIPANSCITKIYASMPNASQNAKYIWIQIIGPAGNIFCHALPNEPGRGISFDTNLIQPLCVGNTAVTALVTAFNQNNNAINELLTLTVAYCPDCC
ncbi:MAG: hypothetical protein ABRQ25_11505 [Clostridiaceae bacterium]